jgi:hypothetical protein
MVCLSAGNGLLPVLVFPSSGSWKAKFFCTGTMTGDGSIRFNVENSLVMEKDLIFEFLHALHPLICREVLG